VLQGFALGFLFVPLTTATLADVPRARLSNATGVYTLVRQLGGSLGIAILQLIEQRKEDTAYSTLASGVTASNPAVAAMLQSAHNTGQSLQSLVGMVQQQATVIAYDDVFRLSALIFVLSIPTVFLLSGKKPSSGETPVVAE
jgi:DHA2 family multidrug resistance protein